MTTLDNLLRGICEHPADTHRRLVYADACEDTGDVDRATFIRVQCQIAARGEMRCSKTGDAMEWYKFTSRCRCEACKLRRTEYMSSRRHVVWDWSPRGSYSVKFERGFVNAVRSRMLVWERADASIVKEHPVTYVEFSGLVIPWYRGRPCLSRAATPECIWKELVLRWGMRVANTRDLLFDTEAELRDALSTAAITWARSVAELPPLETPAT